MKSIALNSCPQEGCVLEYIQPLKKPNSAMRKVARMRLTNGKKVKCIYRR